MARIRGYSTLVSCKGIFEQNKVSAHCKVLWDVAYSKVALCIGRGCFRNSIKKMLFQKPNLKQEQGGKKLTKNVNWVYDYVGGKVLNPWHQRDCVGKFNPGWWIISTGDTNHHWKLYLNSCVSQCGPNTPTKQFSLDGNMSIYQSLSEYSVK